jgi:hypothetical protein
MKNPEDSNTKVQIVFYSVGVIVLAGPVVYGYYDWIFTDKGLAIEIGTLLCNLPVVFIVGFMIDTIVRFTKVTDAVDTKKV